MSYEVANVPGTISWQDVSLTFARNPLTSDIMSKTGMEAIKQSLQNLFLTRKGERAFHPEIGSDMGAILFEPLDIFTKTAIIDDIKTVIENWEPRVGIVSVNVYETVDANEILIELAFRIIRPYMEQVFKTSIPLKRVR